MANFIERQKRGISAFIALIMFFIGAASIFNTKAYAESGTVPPPVEKVFNSTYLHGPDYADSVTLSDSFAFCNMDSDQLTLLISLSPIRYENQILVSKDPGNGNAGWSIELLKSGQIQFNIGSLGGARVSVVTKEVMYWQKYVTNLAVTYGNGKAKIYYEGQPVPVYLKGHSAEVSDEITGIDGVSVLSNANIIFGGTSEKPFRGTVSNIFLYKSVLTDDEIYKLTFSPIWTWEGQDYSTTAAPPDITGLGSYLFSGIQPNEVASSGEFTICADVTLSSTDTSNQQLFFRGEALYYNSLSVQIIANKDMAIHGNSTAWEYLSGFCNIGKQTMNITISYSGSNKRLKVYRDGILAYTASKSLGSPPAGSVLSIGRRLNKAGGDFKGKIQNVKVYHKVLSDYDVAQMNNINDPSITPPPRPADPAPIPDPDEFTPMPTPKDDGGNGSGDNDVIVPEPTEGSIVLRVTDMQKEGEDSRDIYQRAGELLYKLGILNGDKAGNINLGQNVTKGEMAVLLVRLLGIDTDAVKGLMPIETFTDVPSGHYAADAIMAAKALGIVNGINQTMFGTNENVTYQQALKMIVAALGYSVKATAKGGYPNGYILTAAELGIARGVSLQADKPVTRGIIAKLLSNSLEIDIMEDLSFDGNSYQEKKGVNFLEKMNVAKLTGVVTSNQYTGIPKGADKTDCYPRVSKGYVTIDGQSFKVGDASLDKYLGEKVSIYYKKDGSDNIILHTEIATDNTMASFNAWSVAEIDVVNAGDKYHSAFYSENGDKADTVYISKDAVCIYNDVYDSEYLFNNIRNVIANRNGNMRIFDTDNDGVYDVVHVYQYKAYVVDSASIQSNTVKFKNSDTVLDMNVNRIECTIYKGNSIIGLGDLKEYDILNIAVSKDDMVLKAYLTVAQKTDSFTFPVTVAGTITEIEARDDFGVYTIVDKNGNINRYETTISFWNRNKNNYKVNDTGIFYFDQYGRIVTCVSGKEATGLYGYLMAIGEKGLGPMQFKILTGEGDMVVYDAADKVFVNYQSQVDGNMYRKEIKDIRDCNVYFSKYDAETGKWLPNRQLIKYNLDKDGKIIQIYTAKDEFEFLCVPVTDYTADGLPKRYYNRPTFEDMYGTYGGYDINDFYTDTITRRKLPLEKVAVDRSDGLLPLSVFASEDRTNDSNYLRRHYINYDVGKYTVDSSSFSFFRISGYSYKPDWSSLQYDTDAIKKGMVRSVFYTTTNSSDPNCKTTFVFQSATDPSVTATVTGQDVISGSGDIADSLSNLPGRLTKVATDLDNVDNDYALVDGRYILTSKTKIFYIPAFIDGNGNIFDSSTASDDEYSVITTQFLRNDTQYAMQLFDIDENNQVRAAIIINPLTLGYVTKGTEKNYSFTATLLKKPVCVLDEDGEQVYKYEARLTNGKDIVLYSKKDSAPKCFGSLMRWFDDNGKKIGNYAAKYFKTISGSVNDPPTSLPSITTTSELAATRVKGYYEDIKMNEMSVGSVFTYTLGKDGFVDNLEIVFEPNKTDFYFQANLTSRVDNRFLGDTFENKYKTYTNTTIYDRYVSGLISTGYTYNYGKIKCISSVDVNNRPYIIMQTQIPIFVYYDRLSAPNPAYQHLYGDDYNTPKPLDVERYLNISSSAKVYSLNKTSNSVSAITLSDLMPGDEVFIIGSSFILRVTED